MDRKLKDMSLLELKGLLFDLQVRFKQVQSVATEKEKEELEKKVTHVSERPDTETK